MYTWDLYLSGSGWRGDCGCLITMAAGSGLISGSGSVSASGGREFSGEEDVGEGDWMGAESERVWNVGGLVRRPQDLVCLFP